MFRKKIVRSYDELEVFRDIRSKEGFIGNAMKQVACKICWFNKLFRWPDIY